MYNELMSAIWKSPAVLLHQRNEGVAKQLLLSLVLSCYRRTHTVDVTLSPKYASTTIHNIRKAAPAFLIMQCKINKQKKWNLKMVSHP